MQGYDLLQSTYTSREFSLLANLRYLLEFVIHVEPWL